MTYTQPELPYDADALAPVISQETVDFHYGKHEKAYIDNLNRLIKDTEFEDMDLEDCDTHCQGPAFQQCVAGMEPYFLFLLIHSAGLRRAQGRASQGHRRDFGSLDAFKKAFEDAGAGLFGSGWVWLSRDQDGKLLITQEI